MSFSGSTVYLKSAINVTTGYGNDGVNIARTLLDLGADVYLRPFSVGVSLPSEVASLFTKSTPGRVDLVIDHMDPKQLGISSALASFAKSSVAWTMWEYGSFGNDTEIIRNLEYYLKNYSLVLAYDETSKEALSPYVDPDKLGILQGGYDSSAWQIDQDTRDWNSTFRFAMVGALNARKNPFAVIKAFQILKDRHGDSFDATLELKNIAKTLHPDMEKSYPWLKLYYAVWPQETLREFYSSIHCLVAPSWGEGKNLPALEAQSMGVPVIVSDIGGHRQWARKEWAYLVGGSTKHYLDQPYLDVDVEQLAETMWHVYSNRGEAREKGQLASQVIPAQCDWYKVLDRLSFKIQSI